MPTAKDQIFFLLELLKVLKDKNSFDKYSFKYLKGTNSKNPVEYMSNFNKFKKHILKMKYENKQNVIANINSILSKVSAEFPKSDILAKSELFSKNIVAKKGYFNKTGIKENVYYQFDSIDDISKRNELLNNYSIVYVSYGSDRNKLINEKASILIANKIKDDSYYSDLNSVSINDLKVDDLIDIANSLKGRIDSNIDSLDGSVFTDEMFINIAAYNKIRSVIASKHEYEFHNQYITKLEEIKLSEEFDDIRMYLDYKNNQIRTTEFDLLNDNPLLYDLENIAEAIRSEKDKLKLFVLKTFELKKNIGLKIKKPKVLSNISSTILKQSRKELKNIDRRENRNDYENYNNFKKAMEKIQKPVYKKDKYTKDDLYRVEDELLSLINEHGSPYEAYDATISSNKFINLFKEYNNIYYNLKKDSNTFLDVVPTKRIKRLSKNRTIKELSKENKYAKNILDISQEINKNNFLSSKADNLENDMKEYGIDINNIDPIKVQNEFNTLKEDINNLLNTVEIKIDDNEKEKYRKDRDEKEKKLYEEYKDFSNKNKKVKNELKKWEEERYISKYENHLEDDKVQNAIKELKKKVEEYNKVRAKKEYLRKTKELSELSEDTIANILGVNFDIDPFNDINYDAC